MNPFSDITPESSPTSSSSTASTTSASNSSTSNSASNSNTNSTSGKTFPSFIPVINKDGKEYPKWKQTVLLRSNMLLYPLPGFNEVDPTGRIIEENGKYIIKPINSYEESCHNIFRYEFTSSLIKIAEDFPRNTNYNDIASLIELVEETFSSQMKTILFEECKRSMIYLQELDFKSFQSSFNNFLSLSANSEYQVMAMVMVFFEANFGNEVRRLFLNLLPSLSKSDVMNSFASNIRVLKNVSTRKVLANDTDINFKKRKPSSEEYDHQICGSCSKSHRGECITSPYRSIG